MKISNKIFANEIMIVEFQCPSVNARKCQLSGLDLLMYHIVNLTKIVFID